MVNWEKAIKKYGNAQNLMSGCARDRTLVKASKIENVN